MRDGVFDVSELMTKRAGCTRRLLFVGLVAVAILGLIITAIAVIVLNGQADKGDNGAQSPLGISLNEWLDGALTAKSFNGTWISGNEIFYEDESGNLIIFNVSSKQSHTVMNVSNPVLEGSVDHQLSADRKYLLLATNWHKLFRHTYLAHYKIVNLETMSETLLGGNDSTSNGLHLAVWAPRGNALVYVQQNNLYYRPRAEAAVDYQITASGAFGIVYNGVPDWVYEEEVLSSNKAIWFSPNATKLAFGHFDDSQTPVMNIPFYGFPGLTFQYPSAVPIHYPKSGTRNPLVKLYYVDLDLLVQQSARLVEIQPPKDLVQPILAAVAFPTEELVAVTWMNRVQNEAYFRLCNVTGATDTQPNCTTALHYREKNGWVEQFTAPLFSRDGRSFIVILPQPQADAGDWRQVVLVSGLSDLSRARITALTSGTTVVTELLSWDEDNDYVYYLATAPEDPAQKHLYRANTLVEEGEQRPRGPGECLSCELQSEMTGDYCLYNSAEFSRDSSHYAITCAGPGIPSITIHDRNGSKLYTWERNQPIGEIMARRARPIAKRFTVPVPGGFEAQVKLLLPPGADTSGKTKYPMLVYVYGGPDTNEVTEKFSIDWATYLVTKMNVIYAYIDGRGSGLKGNSMMFTVYRNLGTVEIMDQLNVTRHLQNSFEFIDGSRTAIWGWSYGGYATAMALAMDFEGVFKCGMSVAPVTDWMLYDSIYTERLMGLPSADDNQEGYEKSQLLNKVDNIRNKEFYMIHGTFDDNVHYQQSMMLAKMLEQKDILFRQQTYTDEAHDIWRMRHHLYHSMEKFIGECFKKPT